MQKRIRTGPAPKRIGGRPTAANFKLKRTADLSPAYEHLFVNPTRKPTYKILKPVKNQKNALVHARYGLIFNTEKYIEKGKESRRDTDSASPTPPDTSSPAPEEAQENTWSKRLLKLLPPGVTLPEKAGKWKSLDDYVREQREQEATQGTQGTQEG